MKKDIDLLNKAYNKVRRVINESSNFNDPNNRDDYEEAQRNRLGMNNPDLEEEMIAEEIEDQYADMDSDMWSRVCEILCCESIKPT